MLIKDRIKELRRVPASELLPSPKNWRTHPDDQANALRGLLAEVGYANAVLARETPAGLMLIDGHLPAETTGDGIIPVLILDVTEDERSQRAKVKGPPSIPVGQADDDTRQSWRSGEGSWLPIAGPISSPRRPALKEC